MFKDEDIILQTKHVTKEFPASNNRILTACSDISLNFYKGKTLGLVGESGCGKSTFMKMLVQLEPPTKGEILFHGQDITKLKGEKLRQSRKHIQMVFQDPSSAFNPKMKIKEIICEPLLNFNLIKKSEMDKVAKKYLKLVELPEDFTNRYPHNMSGGQRQRIGIARALTLEPELIICDEATSALDVSVQKNIIELIAKIQKEKDISIGFICHDIALVGQMAHQVAVMYLGNIVEVIPGEDLHKNATHPYTKALMGSIFSVDMDYSKKIDSIDSEIPSPLDAPPGCPFQNRCEFCKEICTKEKPKLVKINEGHFVSCHLYPEKNS